LLLIGGYQFKPVQFFFKSIFALLLLIGGYQFNFFLPLIGDCCSVALSKTHRRERTHQAFVFVVQEYFLCAGRCDPKLAVLGLFKR
jgi:hypothetical protein